MHTIYTDGGSRGNPGPSACGYVIYDQDDNLVADGGKFLGLTTNNQAEYFGAIEALKWFDDPSQYMIELRMDSLVVINQINGKFKVKNRDLWPHYEKTMELLSAFKDFKANHVYRENNKEADAIVNQILDDH